MEHLTVTLEHLRVTLGDLRRTSPDFESLEKGTCPDTDIPDRTLKVKAFGVIWTREVEWIDMAEFDYHVYMVSAEPIEIPEPLKELQYFK